MIGDVIRRDTDMSPSLMLPSFPRPLLFRSYSLNVCNLKLSLQKERKKSLTYKRVKLRTSSHTALYCCTYKMIWKSRNVLNTK